MSQILGYVGSDVSKHWLDVFVRPVGLKRRFPNKPEGIAELALWLGQLDLAVTAVGLEASGGYEREAARGLLKAGFPVRILDPLRVRRFAQAAGQRAKNDEIDARVIADFLAAFSQEACQFDTERDDLAELVQLRATLLDMRTQLINAAEHLRSSAARRLQARLVGTLETQAKKLEGDMAQLIRTSEKLKEADKLLRSVQGIGPVTTATLLAFLPELGRIGDKQVAALVGVAPFDRDSGAWSGKRHIQGGRARVRKALYMAAMVAATRCNPWLKAFYKRLLERGKKPKVALVACMNKLIRLLNQILARGYGWQPAPA